MYCIIYGVQCTRTVVDDNKINYSIYEYYVCIRHNFPNVMDNADLYI